MTRPKRPSGPAKSVRGKNNSGAQPAKSGSRGHAPKKMTAQGRGGITRDTVRPVRDNPARDSSDNRSENRPDSRPQERSEGHSPARRYGSASKTAPASNARKAPPRIAKKPLPELKRVQLNAPAPDTQFTDRDGQKVSFPDSNLRRVAAQILTDFRKPWRYRAFDFPLFTDRGHEQSFHFDFYIYDAEDSVIRLILVIPFESREVWDKVGRFKRQYPMYAYELWTPEKLAALSGPRGRLGW